MIRDKSITVNLLLLLGSLELSTFAYSLPWKICALNMAESDKPFSESLRNIFRHKPGSILIEHAVPADITRVCIEGGLYDEILIIAHSEKLGETDAQPVYLKSFEGEEKQNLINAKIKTALQNAYEFYVSGTHQVSQESCAASSIEEIRAIILQKQTEFWTRENELHKKLIRPDTRSAEEATLSDQDLIRERDQIRDYLYNIPSHIDRLNQLEAEIQKLESIKSDPNMSYFTYRPIHDRAFKQAYEALHVLNQDQKTIPKLKRIRWIGCYPELISSRFPSLTKILTDYSIALEFAPQSSWLAFTGAKELVPYSEDWVLEAFKQPSN